MAATWLSRNTCWLKALPHTPHLNFLASSWMRMCGTSEASKAKDRRHNSQEKCLFFVCTTAWRTNLEREKKILSQSKQGYSLGCSSSWSSSSGQGPSPSSTWNSITCFFSSNSEWKKQVGGKRFVQVGGEGHMWRWCPFVEVYISEDNVRRVHFVVKSAGKTEIIITERGWRCVDSC